MTPVCATCGAWFPDADDSPSACPICEDDRIVLVTYAFGNGLPASGRCITAKGELAKLAKGRSQLAVYVVEVCPSCHWNHLAKTFLLGTG